MKLDSDSTTEIFQNWTLSKPRFIDCFIVYLSINYSTHNLKAKVAIYKVDYDYSKFVIKRKWNFLKISDHYFIQWNYWVYSEHSFIKNWIFMAKDYYGHCE